MPILISLYLTFSPIFLIFSGLFQFLFILFKRRKNEENQQQNNDPGKEVKV